MTMSFRTTYRRATTEIVLDPVDHNCVCDVECTAEQVEALQKRIDAGASKGLTFGDYIPCKHGRILA